MVLFVCWAWLYPFCVDVTVLYPPVRPYLHLLGVLDVSGCPAAGGVVLPTRFCGRIVVGGGRCIFSCAMVDFACDTCDVRFHWRLAKVLTL